MTLLEPLRVADACQNQQQDDKRERAHLAGEDETASDMGENREGPLGLVALTTRVYRGNRFDGIFLKRACQALKFPSRVIIRWPRPIASRPDHCR